MSRIWCQLRDRQLRMNKLAQFLLRLGLRMTNNSSQKPVPQPTPRPPIKVIGDSMPKGIGGNKTK